MSIDTNSSKPCSSLWEKMNWTPSEKQLEQFIHLQAIIKYWNKKTNLTRLIEGQDYWVGQIFDSLWPLNQELNNPYKSFLCVDVGSGCGFPGLAVAIGLPKSKIVLIDSSRKKTDALDKISKEIGLSSRIEIHTKRAESIGQDSYFRGTFDIAMARAVAPAPVVSEYLIPLLKKNGEALLYKGLWNEVNQQSLNEALIPLEAKIKQVNSTQLPENRGTRNLIRLVPKGPCPEKYPRSIGIPTKRPLGND